jgi:hypothetical protein
MKRMTALILALLCLCLCGCGKSSAIREAEGKIAAIGTVTADSGDAIEQAQAALDALSAKQREKVENAAELPRAREAWKQAVAEKEERERQARLDALRGQLIGSWEFTEDATDDYGGVIDQMIASFMGPSELHFSDYVDGISVTGTFSLLNNGTYKIGFSKAQIEAFVDSLIQPLHGFYFDMLKSFMAQLLFSDGISFEIPDSDEEWIAATGVDFNTLMSEELGTDLDSYIDYMIELMRDLLVQTMGESKDILGNYAVEDGKLLLSATLEEPVGEDRFVTFTLDGGELTLTGYMNMPDFGKQYPISMRRAT